MNSRTREMSRSLTSARHGVAGRISAETVSVPVWMLSSTIGFILGGLVYPAVIAGGARLTDVAVGRVSRWGRE